MGWVEEWCQGSVGRKSIRVGLGRMLAGLAESVTALDGQKDDMAGLGGRVGRLGWTDGWRIEREKVGSNISLV